MRLLKLTLSTSMAVLLAALLCSPQVFAGGDRDHSGGFFLRLSGGGAAASTKISEGPDELKFDGGAGDINLAIGGVVSPNLAIHGTIWGWTISDPDVSLNGLTGTANGDLTMSGLGAGLTYYFMPANIYLSASLGGGWLSVNGGGFDETSDMGFAGDLTLGKEWWVGNSWGLGVAIAGSLHSVPVSGLTQNFKGGSFAVRFTATMN